MICDNCEKENQLGVGGYFCGQAFTDWKCQKCGKVFTHHNTATPKICKKCSEKYNLCEECGKELI